MTDTRSTPYKRIPAFKNRWILQGTLTTLSNLHIGDGGEGSLQNRAREAKKDNPESKESDASTVSTSVDGKAYLPGSGLRGGLRALIPNDPCLTGQPDWTALFGSECPDGEDARGGKLRFWDAFHHQRDEMAKEAYAQGSAEEAYASGSDADRCRPFWSPRRRTCVAVNVSLERGTRTSMKNLLYHLEYVPPGETFAVEIGGDDLSTLDMAGILALLDQFGTGRARLGALDSNGWGRMDWKLEAIRCMDEAALKKWKENPSTGVEACPPVSADTWKEILALKGKVSLPPPPCTLSLCLCLSLDSPWLIRDARQKERAKAHKEAGRAEVDKPADAVPLHWVDGKPYVPAKGLRGALRARAEMILRTLGLTCADHPTYIPAVSPKSRASAAQGKTPIEQVKAQDLAAQLFGFSGWGAPLETCNLHSKDWVGELPQEYLAIDRFTGGNKPGAKFDAVQANPAELRGRLRVDLDRLAKVDRGLASLGLLALVLRDLKEGDIPIGSGASKGLGHCTVAATVVEEESSRPGTSTRYESLEQWFQNSTQLKSALRDLRATPRRQEISHA